MSPRRGPFSDVSWFQVVASALAAVTAAWIASRLGVGGTLIGAALISFVATLSSAFYHKTLDHGRTMLIQTERGTVIERHVDEGEVSDAFSEARDVDSPVIGAHFVDDGPRLHWKTIVVTTVVVLAIALAAITTFELIAQKPLGGSGEGTTIGDTLGGGPPDTPKAPERSEVETTVPPTSATTPPPTTTTLPPSPTPSVDPSATLPSSPATTPAIDVPAE